MKGKLMFYRCFLVNSKSNATTSVILLV